MIKICKYCGAEFETKTVSKWCSDACRLTDSKVKELKKKAAKPKIIKTCEYCGIKFEASRQDRLYCSKTCCSKANHNIANGKPKTPPKKPKYSIEDIQRLARAEGLTYGQYMTRHYKELYC